MTVQTPPLALYLWNQLEWLVDRSREGETPQKRFRLEANGDEIAGNEFDKSEEEARSEIKRALARGALIAGYSTLIGESDDSPQLRIVAFSKSGERAGYEISGAAEPILNLGTRYLLQSDTAVEYEPPELPVNTYSDWTVLTFAHSQARSWRAIVRGLVSPEDSRRSPMVAACVVSRDGSNIEWSRPYGDLAPRLFPEDLSRIQSRHGATKAAGQVVRELSPLLVGFHWVEALTLTAVVTNPSSEESYEAAWRCPPQGRLRRKMFGLPTEERVKDWTRVGADWLRNSR